MQSQEENIRTVVLGASSNQSRSSYTAVNHLHRLGYTAIPIGARPGTINGIEILIGQPVLEQVHTVTLYLNRERQKMHYNYILSLHPCRIIFNPGSENAELAALAREAGIEVVYNCTLVMLATRTY